MSRLELFTPSKDQLMVESLYKNLEQRIVASPPGICPVDITRAFIEMCHAQTCGKCVPCRVGLHQLKHMITNVLNGDADYEILDLIEGDATVFEKYPLEEAARRGQLDAYRHNGFWQCMDTMNEKKKLEEMWRSGNAPWKVWE